MDIMVHNRRPGNGIDRVLHGYVMDMLELNL